ncbi:hypothetical protein ACWDRX_37805, partial [Streptomyces nigra]
QLLGFCAVGILSTVFYLLLYSAFRTFAGSQTGTKEQREKALAVIGDARKKLYLILADED